MFDMLFGNILRMNKILKWRKIHATEETTMQQTTNHATSETIYTQAKMFKIQALTKYCIWSNRIVLLMTFDTLLSVSRLRSTLCILYVIRK